jgi:hypothetical protein
MRIRRDSVVLQLAGPAWAVNARVAIHRKLRNQVLMQD